MINGIFAYIEPISTLVLAISNIILAIATIASGIIGLVLANVEPISTLVLAFATIALVYFSRLLYLETQKMRELQIQPVVSIYTSQNSKIVTYIELIIKNTGPGTAYNVIFQVNPDFYWGSKNSKNLLKDLPLIDKGLSTMSPDQQFQFLLIDLLEYTQSTVPGLDIIVTYQNEDGKKYNQTFSMDFVVYYNLLSFPDSDLHEISNSLKSIDENLSK